MRRWLSSIVRATSGRGQPGGGCRRRPGTAFVAFVVLVGLLQFFTADALYFARTEDDVAIPFNYSTNQTFYEAFVLRSAAEPINSSIIFHLKDTPISSKSIQSSALVPSIFGINPSQTGVSQSVQLYLRPEIEAVRSSLKHSPVNVIICAKHEDVVPHHSPCLKVKVKFLPTANIKTCSNATTLCFGPRAQLAFEIMENSEPQSLARLDQQGNKQLCNITPSYQLHLLPGHQSQVIQINGSEFPVVLELTESLNRERFKNIDFRITCRVDINNRNQPQMLERNGSIVVRDENEHGPVVVKTPIVFEVVNGIVEELAGYEFGVADNDPEPSPYLVEILDDHERFFKISYRSETLGNENHKKFVIMSELKQRTDFVHFPGDNYTFRVRYVDTTLKVPKVSPEAFITVILERKGDARSTNSTLLDNIKGRQYNGSVFQNAAMYSRVIQPFSSHLTAASGVTFFLKPMPGQLIFPAPFSVTPDNAIVYVNDTAALLNANVSETNPVLTLRLSWKTSKKEVLGFVILLIDVIKTQDDGNISYNIEPCAARNHMCALNSDENSCLATCGAGAQEGRCQWRNHTTYRKTPYATCSPDLTTCPDDVCDELERRHPTVCPQDCVGTDNIHGSVIGFGSKAHGIQGASGTCTCDEQAKCTCSETVGSSHYSEEEEENHRKVGGDYHGDDRNQTINELPVIGTHSQATCDWRCIMIILAVASGIVISVVLLAFCFWRKRKFDKVLAGRHKYPGSLASLPAVPSDYVDERSSSVVSQHVAHNEMHMIAQSNKFMPIDSKWEFSRTKLIMEQTLGEGEFGRVMKAKAMDINGQPGYSTVAVKMLKCNGLNSDMDLLSEFNLLKDVCHPNVIRLLGACSGKDGPLFIIVEYAEFGSLRSYLRKTRRLEFKSCTSDDSGVDSMANGCQADHPLSEYQVNPGDLLSFGWQIAKGMAYLSEMKLVHRDLAARNILVASGKVVKISDFGLTRDVYEGDTYMKKSLGRVPVKWMAIESLLDHVYTTKSDVWSFGIVLWEIVTLGAAPYPGVSPEMLFHLLKSGYRMEKPDNCSDELYKLMSRCWLESPYERPPFSELTKIFDELLQANVEYLDLGLNMVQNLTYFEDTPALTDTLEAEEGEESEMGYGSWNVLPTDDSDYLQINPRSTGDDEDAFLLEKVPGAMALSASRTEICYVEEDAV